MGSSLGLLYKRVILDKHGYEKNPLYKSTTLLNILDFLTTLFICRFKLVSACSSSDFSFALAT